MTQEWLGPLRVAGHQRLLCQHLELSRVDSSKPRQTSQGVPSSIYSISVHQLSKREPGSQVGLLSLLSFCCSGSNFKGGSWAIMGTRVPKFRRPAGGALSHTLTPHLLMPE